MSKKWSLAALHLGTFFTAQQKKEQRAVGGACVKNATSDGSTFCSNNDPFCNSLATCSLICVSPYNQLKVAKLLITAAGTPRRSVASANLGSLGASFRCKPQAIHGTLRKMRHVFFLQSQIIQGQMSHKSFLNANLKSCRLQCKQICERTVTCSSTCVITVSTCINLHLYRTSNNMFQYSDSKPVLQKPAFNSSPEQAWIIQPHHRLCVFRRMPKTQPALHHFLGVHRSQMTLQPQT